MEGVVKLMNKQGFTLMEILAVLLIIALIASFAMPAIRAVRAEVQYQQAKSAAVKMVDAMRSYYQNTRGFLPVNGQIKGKLEGTEGENTLSPIAAAQTTCTDKWQAQSGQDNTVDMSQLFACSYLTTKDFAGLPYLFVAHDDPFNKKEGNAAEVLLTVTGTAAAGRHAGDVFTVHRDGSVKEVE